MSNISNSWIRHLLGQLNYQSLNGSSETPPPDTLPGHFPEEPVVPTNRNPINSNSIQKGFKNLGNYISFLIIKPIIIILVISFRILAKFVNVIYFRDHYNRTRSSSSSNLRLTNNTIISDPIDKANKFIRDLEDNLSPTQHQYLENNTTPQLPPFFVGSYTQSLYMATNRAKFLFVYLSNPQNEHSSVLFNKIITNPEFISLFNSNPNTLIWGGDLTNPEAYQLANSLNVTKFPFLGLLCLTRTTTMSPQGPVKTNPKISLILKVQGGCGEDIHTDKVIIGKFKKKICKFETELSVMRAELRDKYMSQVLLRQQDLKYQDSLKKDQLKKQEKLNRQLQKEYLSWRTSYFMNLKQDTNNEGKAKIAIKLTDGERVTFYFPADDPIENIFTFVELQSGGYLDNDSTSTLTDEEAEVKFKIFTMKFGFKLLSPLPPRIVLNNYLKETETIKIKDVDSIYPNGLLIVENL